MFTVNFNRQMLFLFLIVNAFLRLPVLDLEAKVIETRHVVDAISLIDEDTWLLVDLDNCMFEGAQALGHANWFYDLMKENMQKGMSRDDAIKMFYPDWIKTQKVCRVKALELDFIPSLLELQDKGIVIMGLTHRQPLIADSTIKQVDSLGFSFLDSAPSKDCFIVPSSNPTLYSNGILFVNDYNRKIDVFLAFMEAINKKPKKVVFMDDQRKNVEELEGLLQHDIEYIGVHYTAIEHAMPLYDRKIAEFQYKFLDQIMSNEAALILMENGLD